MYLNPIANHGFTLHRSAPNKITVSDTASIQSTTSGEYRSETLQSHPVMHSSKHNIISFCTIIQANITVLAWAKGGLFIVVGEKVILFILLVYLVAVAYIGWASVSPWSYALEAFE